VNVLREKWILLLAAVASLAIILTILYNPYTGPDLLDDPVQSPLSQSEQVIHQGSQGPVTLEKLASYQITAAVKSRKDYTADYSAQVSPLDLALAWGELNKADIDAHIRYSQSGRWYYFRYDTDVSVDQAYIYQHSANVHLIPENKRIERQLKRIRKNDLVQLEGYLVRVQFTTGSWTSSLSRQDTGDGSCEILYVTSVRIN
jgi:hypothetical protein